MKRSSRSWSKLVLPALLVLLVGAPVLLFCAMLLRPLRPPTPSQRALRPQGVTQNDYKALRSTGAGRLTYAEAAARLGEGTLLDSSADGRTRTYQWHGGGRWARLEATFRDGGLVSKQQALLSR